MSDGTSSARMIDASISTAKAAPMPSSLMSTIEDVANAPIATANSSAAAVTIRPVRSSPIATPSELDAPASRASLIRKSRNTLVVGGQPEPDHNPEHLAALGCICCSGQGGSASAYADD